MHKQYSDLLRLQMNLKMEPFIYSGVLVERTTGKVIKTQDRKRVAGSKIVHLVLAQYMPTLS